MKNFTLRERFLSLAVCMFFCSLTLMAQTQKATVNLKNTTLTELFSVIEKQTSYRFSYRNVVVDNQTKIVTINESSPVDVILRKALDGTNLEFSIISDKSIVISDVKSVATKGPKFKIIGVVTDNTKQPIIGATAVIKGTTIGDVTAADGSFTLNVEQGSSIMVSMMGYVPLEVKITSADRYNVVLSEQLLNLDEVVVVGYGTQKRGQLATAITTVKSDVITNRPVTSIAEAIQGTVPGLIVTTNNRPGSSSSMQLRGATSLNGGGSPLVLVDGIPSEYNFMNVDDVESMTVLKDAASSAIYGSRAANGVILITTKRGKVNAPKFRYNGSFGVNTPTNYPETVDSWVFANAFNESQTNKGQKPAYTPEDIEKFRAGTDPNHYPNTDWIKYSNQNSLSTKHSIEASGGTDKMRYLLSAGYSYIEGSLPRNNQSVFNVRSNTDVKLAKKLDLSFDLRYQLQKLNDVPNSDDIRKQFYSMSPNKIDYYTDGTYGYNNGFFINPLVNLYEGGTNTTNRHDALGTFKLNYEFIDGLKFTGIASGNFVFKQNSVQSRELRYKDFDTQQEYVKELNSLSERRDESQYYNLQAFMSYTKTFGKHDIDVMAGYQQESSNSTYIGASRSGYPTDLVWVLDGGPTDNWRNNGNGEHWALASFVARANYAYDNKYMLSGSVRVDGSSRFKKENRWATFASVSGAWRISQEKFMASTKNVINDLKLRASWGQTGAATGLGLYPSYSSIGMNSVVLDNQWMQTARLTNIGNPELSWELTEMVNIGVDFSTLRNRLSFTGEYYIKTSKDILIGLPVPMEYGFGKPNTNIGKMRNRGWELELAWRDNAGDFNYSVSGNISDNRNEVLDLGGTGPWKSSTYSDVGQPFNQIYGYESMGLFQTKDELKNAPFQSSVTDVGDVRYKNQNDDNKIDANDRVVLGDTYAHFVYGVRFAADYKNFDLSVLLQGIGQKNIFITDYIVRPLQESSMFDHQLDYWRADNPGAKYPRILNKEDGAHNYQMSDYWKQNAGYLRVKNLQIGYTFGKRMMGNSGFDSIRLYFSANNLFTISNITKGIDPETSNSLTYPFARTYSFGLNVQF